MSPVRSLLNLAKMSCSEPRFLETINGSDDETAWKTIQDSPALKPLKVALDQHLDQFGDRGLEELKLENPTFREDPDRLIGLIRSYYRMELNPYLGENEQQSICKRTEKTDRINLTNPFKRLIFRFVLNKARAAVSARENMRFSRSRYFGIVRRIFRRMGEIFAEDSILDSGDDIWYLTVDEVFSSMQGTAVTRNLKGLVNMRKTEYTDYEKRSPAERIKTVGSPYLESLSIDNQVTGNGRVLQGIGCSSGKVEGIACVAPNPHVPLKGDDAVLVAKSTDPGWIFLMISSRGIVVEKGSVLSHTAIIGRELGIPTIVGVKGACSLIPDGSQIWMDAGSGEVKWK